MRKQTQEGNRSAVYERATMRFMWMYTKLDSAEHSQRIRSLRKSSAKRECTQGSEDALWQEVIAVSRPKPDEPELDFNLLDQRIMERAGWRHPDDYPERLYHYTSSAAFLNIITSDELWFSDFRYLNDLSELRYGVDIFKAEVQRRRIQETSAMPSVMLLKLEEQFDAALIYTDVFVFCMCEENNLLNQWRVYGRDTVPISIELATRGFMFEEWEPYRFEIVPMVYDRQLQEKIAREAVSVAIEFSNEHKNSILRDADSIQSFVEMVVSISVDWCISMKDPQFAVEKEWRLATRWGLEHRILTGRSFRSSPSGIVPYLKMRKKLEEPIAATTLPIRSVTIGPCNQPEIQQRTIRELLYQRERADAEIHISSLPIRV